MNHDPTVRLVSETDIIDGSKYLAMAVWALGRHGGNKYMRPCEMARFVQTQATIYCNHTNLARFLRKRVAGKKSLVGPPLGTGRIIVITLSRAGPRYCLTILGQELFRLTFGYDVLTGDARLTELENRVARIESKIG